MISKKYRFHGHGSLNYVHRNGQGERTKYMAIKYTKNERRNHPRFSVIISKKVFKSAVKRNRVRRRVFEIIRHEIKDDSPNLDVVFLLYSPEILDMPHEKLKSEITGLLKAINFC